MNIALIGTGHVGRTLGLGWAKRGHMVAFGARNPEDPKHDDLRSAGNVSIKTIADAAAFGEVVVLATPWPATEEAIRAAGDLSGKIVLDATNPLKQDLSGLEVGLDTSGGEMVAGWAAGASVAKVFNTTGYGNMANPDYGGQAATMFYCADDNAAKAAAANLAADLGFEPVDAGPLSNARLLEPLALLWIRMAIGGMGRDIAFKLLRR